MRMPHRPSNTRMLETDPWVCTLDLTTALWYNWDRSKIIHTTLLLVKESISSMLASCLQMENESSSQRSRGKHMKRDRQIVNSLIEVSLFLLDQCACLQLLIITSEISRSKASRLICNRSNNFHFIVSMYNNWKISKNWMVNAAVLSSSSCTIHLVRHHLPEVQVGYYLVQILNTTDCTCTPAWIHV